MAQTQRYEAPYQEDTQLRNEALFEYLPFVRQTAQRIAAHLPETVEIEDLVSAGTIGLIQAMQRYEPERGIQLRTYAAFRVKGAVLSELRSCDILSRSSRQKVREMEENVARLEQELGRMPYSNETADRMGVALDEYYQVERMGAFAVISGDEPIGQNMNSETLMNQIADEAHGDPLTLTGQKEIVDFIAAAITHLPEKEKLVISLYYDDEMTMKEIGQILAVTESRISQLHSQAVRRLRKALQHQNLLDN